MKSPASTCCLLLLLSTTGFASPVSEDFRGQHANYETPRETAIITKNFLKILDFPPSFSSEQTVPLASSDGLDPGFTDLRLGPRNEPVAFRSLPTQPSTEQSPDARLRYSETELVSGDGNRKRKSVNSENSYNSDNLDNSDNMRRKRSKLVEIPPRQDGESRTEYKSRYGQAYYRITRKVLDLPPSFSSEQTAPLASSDGLGPGFMDLRLGPRNEPVAFRSLPTHPSTEQSPGARLRYSKTELVSGDGNRKRKSVNWENSDNSGNMRRKRSKLVEIPPRQDGESLTEYRRRYDQAYYRITRALPKISTEQQTSKKRQYTPFPRKEGESPDDRMRRYQKESQRSLREKEKSPSAPVKSKVPKNSLRHLSRQEGESLAEYRKRYYQEYSKVYRVLAKMENLQSEPVKSKDSNSCNGLGTRK